MSGDVYIDLGKLVGKDIVVFEHIRLPVKGKLAKVSEGDANLWITIEKPLTRIAPNAWLPSDPGALVLCWPLDQTTITEEKPDGMHHGDTEEAHFFVAEHLVIERAYPGQG